MQLQRNVTIPCGIDLVNTYLCIEKGAFCHLVPPPWPLKIIFTFMEIFCPNFFLIIEMTSSQIFKSVNPLDKSVSAAYSP